MSKLFPNSQHLVRVAGLLVLGLVIFIVLRAIFIPKGFGALGHYRVGALADNRGKPVKFAGKKACLECHTDVEEALKGSRHSTLSCEVCHGPQSAHATAADPSAMKPKKPEAANIIHLCLTCHEANIAKPKGFKQIDPKAHMGGGRCTECHTHHSPQTIKGAEPAAKAAAKPEPAPKAAAQEVKK
jgi:hypothetical protein